MTDHDLRAEPARYTESGSSALAEGSMLSRLREDLRLADTMSGGGGPALVEPEDLRAVIRAMECQSITPTDMPVRDAIEHLKSLKRAAARMAMDTRSGPVPWHAAEHEGAERAYRDAIEIVERIPTIRGRGVQLSPDEVARLAGDGAIEATASNALEDEHG